MYSPTLGVSDIDGAIHEMAAFQIEVVKEGVYAQVCKEGIFLGWKGVEGDHVVQYVRGDRKRY